MGERGEGRGKFLYISIILLCHGLRVISKLHLCLIFIFQLNYENNVKIWLLNLILQK